MQCCSLKGRSGDSLAGLKRGNYKKRKCFGFGQISHHIKSFRYFQLKSSLFFFTVSSAVLCLPNGLQLQGEVRHTHTHTQAFSTLCDPIIHSSNRAFAPTKSSPITLIFHCFVLDKLMRFCLICHTQKHVNMPFVVFRIVLCGACMCF